MRIKLVADLLREYLQEPYHACLLCAAEDRPQEEKEYVDTQDLMCPICSGS